MKQATSSLLEAIAAILIAIFLFNIVNDYMLKYAFPVVFLILATYKIIESIEFFRKSNFKFC